jgi:uncharacterized protein YqgV (UPF0045/DUF77 family)
MPTFYAEDIDIDPDEFLDSCDSQEIEELIDCLVEDGYVVRVNTPSETIADGELDQALAKIKHFRTQLTAEEEEILKKIGNRVCLYPL